MNAPDRPLATVPLAEGAELRLLWTDAGLLLEAGAFALTVPAGELQALHEATGAACCEATLADVRRAR